MPSSTRAARGWLSDDQLADVRDRVPIVYVEAVPVRIDHLGRVESVGLLLRHRPDDTISLAVVSGRVLYGETLREALWRHLAKDLGPEAAPRLPPENLVPVEGECTPAQDTLDLAWLSPADAVTPRVAAEMSGGQDRLVRLALGHAGCLP